jgi:hypothetical protein
MSKRIIKYSLTRSIRTARGGLWLQVAACSLSASCSTCSRLSAHSAHTLVLSPAHPRHHFPASRPLRCHPPSWLHSSRPRGLTLSTTRLVPSWFTRESESDSLPPPPARPILLCAPLLSLLPRHLPSHVCPSPLWTVPNLGVARCISRVPFPCPRATTRVR